MTKLPEAGNRRGHVGKSPQSQDHRQERSQSNGVCNLHCTLFERQTLGCPGVRWRCETVPLTDLWRVCVWRVGWGRETEIETDRGGRQEGCCRAAAWDKRQRERRQLRWPFSG